MLAKHIRLTTAATLISAAYVLSGVSAKAATVTITGDLQSELGCGSDFDPACAASGLQLGPDNQVWKKTFTVPTGTFNYFVTLNGTFDVGYGAGGVLRPAGTALSLTLGGPTAVRFYYDEITHWVTDSVNSVIATLAGSFQNELGCNGDFDPSCMKSWLQDLDGDGTYEFSALLPAADYSFVVALNEEFVIGAKQYDFASNGLTPSTFTYNSRTGAVSIGGGGAAGVVPVPAALPLLASGLGALGFIGWRRKRKEKLAAA